MQTDGHIKDEEWQARRILKTESEPNPILGTMKTRLMKLLGFMLLTASLRAQTFTVIHYNGDRDGYYSWGADMILNGNVLYGTTSEGGTNFNGSGTVFSIDTNGSNYTVLQSFDSFHAPTNGYGPRAGVLLNGGTLYGTTGFGGLGYTGGTLFSVGTNGSNFTVLHAFDTTNEGDTPLGGVVLNGETLYGTTYDNGVSSWGALYSISTNGGNFTVLHYFSGGATDGASPVGSLVLSGGTLYGVTENGGKKDAGTVYSFGTDGSGYTLLFSFTNYPYPALPQAGLVLAGSRLYGTTVQGGADADGTVFSISTNGTGYTVLHTFTNSPDGAGPQADLFLSGSTLYGTTQAGGSTNVGYGGTGQGTIFSISIKGSDYTVLYTFTNSVAEGESPLGDVTLP
jgi:uncharacterized repeat protein (TIGR03803 family)